MKSIPELKKEKYDKLSELFEKVGLFFALSSEQFAKNKTFLKEGDKYVLVGGIGYAGGYLPKSNSKEFRKGIKEINKWYKNASKERKEFSLKAIELKRKKHFSKMTNY
jgi:uncharacterized membrane protein